jgi:hypothetical protein
VSLIKQEQRSEYAASRRVDGRADEAPINWLVRNLRLDKLRQQGERLLPAETARLRWNHIRDPFLDDIHLRPERLDIFLYRNV